MRPRLKDVFWERSGAELRLVRDGREPVRLDDPDGTLELLLDLLYKGSRTPPELAEVVGVPVAAVDRAVDILDRYRLLVDDERTGRIGADTRDRYADNLAFFEPYATLALGREDMLERLRSAHVLLLGLGGVNMTVAAQLCGLGVDRVTVVDSGTIVARDLGWQPLARSRDVGVPTVRRAAAWLRDTEPALHVDAVDAPVTSASTLAATLDRYCPDLVIVDAAGPSADPNGGSRAGPTLGGDGVDTWVNAACVAAGLPFVRAVVGPASATVYSVDPGRSGCVACLASGPASGQTPAVMSWLNQRPGSGLRVAPMAGLLGSLVAFEALRFLTGFEPPAYAGQPVHVDIGSGGVLRRLGWQRSLTCPVCRTADPR
jgi:molybdopterin/thiamine biosynthesis adenylyltransferase